MGATHSIFDPAWQDGRDFCHCDRRGESRRKKKLMTGSVVHATSTNSSPIKTNIRKTSLLPPSTRKIDFDQCPRSANENNYLRGPNMKYVVLEETSPRSEDLLLSDLHFTDPDSSWTAHPLPDWTFEEQTRLGRVLHDNPGALRDRGKLEFVISSAQCQIPNKSGDEIRKCLKHILIARATCFSKYSR
jgi:hypothetical protein